MILMMSNSSVVQRDIVVNDRGLESPRNPQTGKSALRAVGGFRIRCSMFS
jgi:hypothetical protein